MLEREQQTPPTTFDLVRFGLGPGEEPNEQQRAFYAYVARIVAGHTMRYVGSAAAFHTIDTATALVETESIYEPLYRALMELPDRADIGILDLSVSTRTVNTELFLRPEALLHLASAVSAACGSEQWAARTLVILLPTEQAEDIRLREQLDARLASGQIHLLSDGGTASWPGTDEDDYRSALARLQTASIDLFERKLITRLGWFRPHGRQGERKVLRHYFDASRAQDELGHLLDEAIGADRPDLIVYHESVSDWLANPLKGSCISAGSLPIRSFSEAMDTTPTEGPQPRSVLLVVPVVNTGVSLTERVTTLHARLRPERLRVLSVLCVGGPQPRFGRRRIEGNDGTEHEVAYFLSVEQRTESEAECRLAVVGETRRYEERTNTLTTAEFWDLVRTCGVKPEDDVPAPRRRGYAVVPDVPQILEQYGNWLADKLWMFVRRSTSTVGQDILLVCPEREQGSRKLSNSLSLRSGAQVVRIPREDIERVVKGTAPEQVFDARAPWCQELDSVATKEVVLIDEFVGSGDTIRAMERIARAKGLNVKAVCTLLDFSPDAAGQRHSLYGWKPPASQTDLPAQRPDADGAAVRRP
ncbi:phosphoribosyltransferase [Micromonospora sp. NPDC005197]|uniref:phosphoribosyltransferase n=1 Tax=unclassified Micromonospora TaxID=2617518 RepID=UPI00339FB99D